MCVREREANRDGGREKEVVVRGSDRGGPSNDGPKGDGLGVCMRERECRKGRGKGGVCRVEAWPGDSVCLSTMCGPKYSLACVE